LRVQNKFELGEGPGQFDLDFMEALVHNQDGLYAEVFSYILDICQLGNILQIFDFVDTSQVYEVIDDKRVQSLFISSLEVQKFLFMREMVQNESPDVQRRLRQQPYKYYA